MADVKTRIHVGRSHDNPVNSHKRYALKNDEVVKYGTIVKLDSDGELVVAESGDSVYGYITLNEETTGDGEYTPLVEEISSEIDYFMAGDETLDSSDIGKEYNIQLDGNTHVIDKSDGSKSSGDVTILDVQDESMSGGDPKALVKFNSIQ